MRHLVRPTGAALLGAFALFLAYPAQAPARPGPIQESAPGTSTTVAAELPPPTNAVALTPGLLGGLLPGLTELGKQAGVRVLISKQARPLIVGIGHGLDGVLELEPGEAWTRALGLLEEGGVSFELLRPARGPLLWITSGDSAPAPPTQELDPDQLLPAPKSPLRLDPEQSDLLFAAASALAQSSGVRLLVTHEARAVLEDPHWELDAAMTLPAEDAWSFLESILFQLDLILVLHSGAAAPLASIQTLPLNGDPGFRSQALPVGPEFLTELDAHPALYVHLTLPVEALDPLTTANTLRSMAYPANGGTFLSAGFEGFEHLFLPHPDDRAVWLGGRGRTVNAIARAIQLADEVKLAEER